MIEVWGRPNSICTQRVLWACVETGVDFELNLASATMGPGGHVSTGEASYGGVDTPAYLAMNPNGAIPTIKDGDFVLWESNAIVAYIAAKFGAERLYGDNLETFARASQWMSWTNEHLEPPLHVLVMELYRLPAAKRSSGAVDAAARDIAPWIEVLDRHLSTQPYVAGEAFTMGDIPAGAAAYRWTLFTADRPATPHVNTWLERLAVRDGFKRHVEAPALHRS
ncbi:MAG: glutathione S-transferase family protein [Gammaproteobacteria bacterium]